MDVARNLLNHVLLQRFHKILGVPESPIWPILHQLPMCVDCPRVLPLVAEPLAARLINLLISSKLVSQPI
jgi:hypothetical protein